MEKNHNESVLISVKKITNNEYRITNVELKKSAFISVNQRLKKNPKPETKNLKLFLIYNHSLVCLYLVVDVSFVYIFIRR